jgi:hypothetical protein
MMQPNVSVAKLHARSRSKPPAHRGGLQAPSAPSWALVLDTLKEIIRRNGDASLANDGKSALTTALAEERCKLVAALPEPRPNDPVERSFYGYVRKRADEEDFAASDEAVRLKAEIAAYDNALSEMQKLCDAQAEISLRAAALALRIPSNG